MVVGQLPLATTLAAGRYLPTRPTDPNAQRQWGSILAKFEATRSSTTRLHHHRPRSPGPSHAGGGASRPQSAGGGVAYSLVRASHHQPEYGAFPAGAGSHGGGGGGGARPASARMRFTSLSVGEVQRLGAGYAPVAVSACGHERLAKHHAAAP